MSCFLMVFEVFFRLTPLIAYCAECSLTPHHQHKPFILWKSFWPKGASQCSVHYLDLSTLEVWRDGLSDWETDWVTNRRKSLSCYSQLKMPLHQSDKVGVYRDKMYCGDFNVLLQELSKWDKREGYEISAAHSGGMSPEKAFQQWRGSPGHYGVFVPSGSAWSDIKTVGCAWRKTLAHCWLSKKVPVTYEGWAGVFTWM